MRDFTELNITPAVLEKVADTPDPRLRHVMESAIRHLHDFVREIDPSFEEWLAAVRFLTKVGQMCDDKRQEFILLSDTLGVSMLVDAINHRSAAMATPSTVLGPFYVENPPEYPQGADIASGAEGEPLLVDVDVSSVTGHPLAGATVDVWQSDSDGFYDVQRPNLVSARLRGRFRSDPAGHVWFRSIMPTAYPIPYDGPVGQMLKMTGRHPWRPAHLHFMVSAPGHASLVTHIFVEGDRYLDSDVVFGVKNALIDAFNGKSAHQTSTERCLRYVFRLATNTHDLRE